MAGLEGWPWPVWGMSPATLPPCPLCLYWSICPPLPQRSLLSASALGPEQAGPGTLGPILSASCAQIPLLLCSWTCRPCLAQRPLRLPQPQHMLDAPSHCSGGRAGLGEASLPAVSGPCPPAADALQAHNAVFQEHAAPSSPGTAPTARGFRRASEISIASQVSGMAESYTASNIAQSECSSAGACPPRHSKGAVPCRSQSQWRPLCPSPRGQLAASGGNRGGRHWHLVGGDQQCCSTLCGAQDGPVAESDPAPVSTEGSARKER